MQFPTGTGGQAQFALGRGELRKACSTARMRCVHGALGRCDCMGALARVAAHVQHSATVVNAQRAALVHVCCLTRLARW
eukprot:2836973-Alexandrium_andersonii.AAC.1